MSSKVATIYLLFYSFWLASSMPLVEHSRHRREPAQDILGDLTAKQSGILNEDYVPQSSCKKIHDTGFHTSGIYKLNINDGRGEFTVFCDMSLQGGGWTLIQRRIDSTFSFNFNKTEYQVGFGNLNTNFWLGLENIKRLTDYKSATYELYIGLESFFPGPEQFRWAKYGSFGLAEAADGYKLSIGQYDSSSSGGDALYTHNGERFSTPDNDVDSLAEINCAEIFKSGWWFHNCIDSNVNGIYYDDGFHPTSINNGIVWCSWLGETISLKTVFMAIRQA